MEALAAGGLEEAAQVEVLEAGAQGEGGVLDAGPGDLLVGVEVEDDAVGLLGALDGSAPQVELEGADLGEADEALGGVEVEEGGGARVEVDGAEAGGRSPGRCF